MRCPVSGEVFDLMDFIIKLQDSEVVERTVQRDNEQNAEGG